MQGMTKSYSEGLMRSITTKYDIDYIALMAEFQQVKYQNVIDTQRVVEVNQPTDPAPNFSVHSEGHIRDGVLFVTTSAPFDASTVKIYKSTPLRNFDGNDGCLYRPDGSGTEKICFDKNRRELLPITVISAEIMYNPNCVDSSRGKDCIYKIQLSDKLEKYVENMAPVGDTFLKYRVVAKNPYGQDIVLINDKACNVIAPLTEEEIQREMLNGNARDTIVGRVGTCR
jgi:hypothetical protein